jgi:hypothetical protein
MVFFYSRLINVVTDGDAAVAEVIDEERACVGRRSDAPRLHVPLHELRRGLADRHYVILLPWLSPSSLASSSAATEQ